MVVIRESEYSDLRELARIDSSRSLREWYLCLGNLPAGESLRTIHETELKTTLGYIHSKQVDSKTEEVYIVLDENSCSIRHTYRYVMKEFIQKPPRKGVRRFTASVRGDKVDEYTALRGAGFEAYHLTEYKKEDMFIPVIKMSLGVY